MARRCSISGTGKQFGHRVSHANNKTKHAFEPNLHYKRLYVPEEKRYVRVKISTRLLRTIDKLGLMPALRRHNLSLSDIAA